MSRVLDAAEIAVERGPFEMIPHWMLDHGFSSGAVHLWLVLRKHGDETRTSFPGRGRLSESLMVSKSTITRLVNELRGDGALCYRQRKSSDGDYTSNEYHLHWERKTNCTWFTDGLGRPQVDHPRPPTDHGRPQVMNRKRLSKQDSSNKKDLDRFVEFWEVYPKRVGRKAAATKWRTAVKTATPDEIIEAAKRYRDNPKRHPDYTANPETWLNQERWLDEPETPKQSGPVTVMDLYADEPCEHGDPMGEARCPLCRRR